MTTRSLPQEPSQDAGISTIGSFVQPKSIAIIGAAPAEQRTIRGSLMRVLRRCGFKGRIVPVNPSYQEINGLRCYPSISAAGSAVDLAVVAIPAEFVCDVVEECAVAGVRAAIVISSGFAEESAAKARLQLQLTEIAGRTGIRICGPNCEGFYNLVDGIAATFSAAAEPTEAAEPVIANAGKVAVVAQSGGLGFALLNRGRAFGLDFSHIVTTGNECDLTAADFIEYFAGDIESRVVIAYLEEIRDPTRFRLAAERARAAGKTIIIIKIGRSEAGRRAALHHTGSVTGSVADENSMLAKLGVVVVIEPDEAVAAALALVTSPAATGKRAGIVTTAGGAGTVLSECLSAAGFVIPALSDRLQTSLRPTFPSYGSAANPVDVTAQGIFTGGAMQALKVLLEGDEVDLIVFAAGLSSERSVPLDVDALRQLAARSSKPILIYSYTLPSAFARSAFWRVGLPIFAHVRDLVCAAQALRAAGPREPSFSVEAGMPQP
ncbi:CoA-binding protein [Bradyrhizobium sp. Gha]|uniref:CoA-binding protein n=1 Tax=Bradyrhizobium sp. Gha TaxID=1855318 RepID=UPI0008E10165|nr:CoA-binding protein [Bradyrhizobium sp. Gha]SFH66058.1 Acyl-CoA synthetase (NDP forming) [Bradyrhizobium sp. Gha]